MSRFKSVVSMSRRASRVVVSAIPPQFDALNCSHETVVAQRADHDNVRSLDDGFRNVETAMESPQLHARPFLTMNG